MRKEKLKEGRKGRKEGKSFIPAFQEGKANGSLIFILFQSVLQNNAL